MSSSSSASSFAITTLSVPSSFTYRRPAFVDSTLIALDPLTHQRKNEYDWLMSDNFPKLLAAHNVTLA